MHLICVYTCRTFGIYLLSDTHTHQYVYMCKKKKTPHEGNHAIHTNNCRSTEEANELQCIQQTRIDR